jgi:signal transduction histidine kinase
VAGRQAAGRNVVLDVGPDVRALGHEDRLERVIGHLVQNALDATSDSGTVALKIYGDGAQTVVEVWDNGQGMSPEFIRDKLFRPFQSTKDTGMGIGFYESAQYIQELGGEVAVDSQPGSGTRITVTLACQTTAASRSAHSKAAA